MNKEPAPSAGQGTARALDANLTPTEAVMEKDRDRDRTENRAGADKAGSREHTFGKGMTSPDSTEAVLDASTGEPDPRARGEGADKAGQSSKSSRDQDLEQDV